MNLIILFNISLLVAGCFGLLEDERLNSLTFITSVDKKSSIDNFDDAESLALVTQALVDCTFASEVNITTSSRGNETSGTIMESVSLVNQTWKIRQIGLGLSAVSQIGITISGVLPYCRSNHKPEWLNTWQCVSTGISILLGFDASYLIIKGGHVGEIHGRIALKSESDKRDISRNINLSGRHNWLDIVDHVESQGFTPLHLMYDRADLYSDGSVILTNPFVTYGFDNSPIINYMNNGAGFILSIDDSNSNGNQTEMMSTNSNCVVTFAKVGLMSQFDRCRIPSETINFPTDLNMVQGYLDTYWNYNSGHRHNWIIRNNNQLIYEDLLHMYYPVILES